MANNTRSAPAITIFYPSNSLIKNKHTAMNTIKKSNKYAGNITLLESPSTMIVPAASIASIIANPTNILGFIGN